eukprot:COSAG01_NODE_162_length_23597_cov_21.924130_3_plen_92_part_00
MAGDSKIINLCIADSDCEINTYTAEVCVSQVCLINVDQNSRSTAIATDITNRRLWQRHFPPRHRQRQRHRQRHHPQAGVLGSARQPLGPLD